MSRLHMLVLTAAVVGCGGAAKQVHKPGEDYLADIKFEGNLTIDDDVLSKGLSLKPGHSIDEYQLNLDTSRISGAYQRKGFFSVEVRSHVVRSGDAVTLVFTVKEGPRATASVEILGLPPEVPPAEARALVKLDDGAPFEYAAYDGAKASLLARVEDAGYAHAQLDAAVLADRGTNRATLRYAIDAGPRVKVGDIQIVGVNERLTEAARARLTFASGDWYSARELAATQQAILGIGRFSSVRMDVDRTSQEPVLPVKIVLAERGRLGLGLGGGAGVDTVTYELRGRATVSYAGLFTPLTTVGAEFKPAYTVLRDNCAIYDFFSCEYDPRVRLIGTIVQQDLFRPDVKGDVEGGLDYLALEAYTTQGARARVGLGTPVWNRRIDLHVGWQFAYYDFKNPMIDAATQAEIGIDHTERLGAFTQGISLDFRDNQIEPTLGAYFELRVAEGGSYAAGAYSYQQLSPDVRGFLPLDAIGIHRGVLAARARLGLIDGDVPPTERYYVGGAASQRGFGERRLSPEAIRVDKNGMPVYDCDPMTDPSCQPERVVIGGAASFETGVELRSPFELAGLDLGGVVFVDGGDATKTPSELDITDLHWAVGAGIRWYVLPIGPFRLDLAYRLNRTGAGEPSAGDHFQFQFTLGEAY